MTAPTRFDPGHAPPRAPRPPRPPTPPAKPARAPKPAKRAKPTSAKPAKPTRAARSVRAPAPAPRLPAAGASSPPRRAPRPTARRPAIPPARSGRPTPQPPSPRRLRGLPGGRLAAPQAPPTRLRRPAPAAPPVHRRLVVLLVILAVAFVAVVVRLADVQVLSARRYAVFGESQRITSIVLPAERGAILDRNLAELAVSTRRTTIWADPAVVADPVMAARSLAPILNADERALEAKLRTDSNFVYLARKVDDPVAEAVRRLNLSGIQFLDEPKRIVPSGTLAGPVLGEVGTDDEGLSGLELQFQKALTGRAGELIVERDPGGNDIAAGMRQLKPSARGDNLVLTIDRTMQYETERVLAESIVSSRAKGGMAVVMDPLTGEILAMANLVVEKPGTPPVPPADNMALTRVFEPGSTNKVVTIAAALEENVVEPGTHMNVPDTLQVSDALFHDAEDHPLMWWSTSEIMAHSSNIGTIQIAQRLGKAKIDKYLRAFGLAEATALDFPGESGGLMLDADEWSGTSMGSIPIGQGVAVTAVQMLGAYNIVANGGISVAPRLVKATVDAAGNVHETKAPASHRVISEQTATEMAAMLTGAVDIGTGTAARIEGYTVAGKTGTARKPSDTKAGYSDNYMASFVGFLPAESPRLSAIVVLDEPTPYYGGIVSAPVFAALGSFGIQHFGIPPRSAPPGPLTQTVSAAPTTQPVPAVPAPVATGAPTTLGISPTTRP